MSFFGLSLYSLFLLLKEHHATYRLAPAEQTLPSLRRRRGSSTIHHSSTSRLPYLSFTPTETRNSQFANLTPSQRLELGGVEFRALTLLSYLVPGYCFLIQMVASIMIWAYTLKKRPEVGDGNAGGQALNSTHVGTFWVSTFNAVSAFNNNGMSLIDANITVFSGDWYILIIMGFLILAGNTW